MTSYNEMTGAGPPLDTTASEAVATAFIYLRVSSPGQVNKDFNPEGYSIPGQRAACAQRAHSLGAEILEEYVEPGISGRDALKRPSLQRMLADLDRVRPEYVIVYDLSRLARNRLDDALLMVRIEQFGARLVSVLENIDKTPAGRLTHGVLAAVNEFRSAGDAEKVKMGLRRKHEAGGTSGVAPIGYLNTRERVEGREVRTVEIDPGRAPLVRMGFEAFATGEYSIASLQQVLEEAGLRTRETAKRAPAPLSRSAVHKILNNDYYVGIVTQCGAKRPGRHPRLIDDATFERVQQILDAHRLSGDRSQKHQHYLKGSIFCDRCGGRLAYGRHRGNGGVYEYFSCLSRQARRACGASHVPTHKVEQAVERFYVGVRLTPSERQSVRQAVREYAEGLEATARTERERHDRRLTALQTEQRKLLHLYYRDQIDEQVLAEEQHRIQRERADAERWADVAEHTAAEILEVLEEALELLSQPQLRYRQAPAHVRRLLNQALFEKIFILEEWASGAELQPWVEQVQALARSLSRPQRGEESLQGAGNDHGPLFGGHGSYFVQMVRRRGLEPPPG
jgi:site-specific DNA recombinase